MTLQTAASLPASPTVVQPSAPLEPIPEDLVQSILRGNCVAFVGAGFSVPAKLPSWSDLLKHVIVRATDAGLLAADSDLRSFLLTTIDAAVAKGSG